MPNVVSKARSGGLFSVSAVNAAVLVLAVAGAAHAQEAPPPSEAAAMESHIPEPLGLDSEPAVFRSAPDTRAEAERMLQEEKMATIMGVEPEKPSSLSITQGNDSLAALVAGTNGAESRVVLPGDAHVPWVLGSDGHPSAIAEVREIRSPSLVLNLSSPRDLRIMLPGVMRDQADTARYISNKFITDSVGVASQVRGRILADLQAWHKDLITRYGKLDLTDPWVKYQFTKEIYQTINPFEEKFRRLTDNTIGVLQQSIEKGVAELTQAMNAVEDYEGKMIWYNSMVQLNEGLQLYQAQALANDAAIHDVLKEVKAQFPIVEQPKGPLPLTPEQLRAKAIADAAKVAPMAEINSSVVGTSGEAKQIHMEADSSTTGGLIAAGGALAAIAGVFFMLRRKKKAQFKADSSF